MNITIIAGAKPYCDQGKILISCIQGENEQKKEVFRAVALGSPNPENDLLNDITEKAETLANIEGIINFNIKSCKNGRRWSSSQNTDVEAHQISTKLLQEALDHMEIVRAEIIENKIEVLSESY